MRKNATFLVIAKSPKVWKKVEKIGLGSLVSHYSCMSHCRWHIFFFFYSHTPSCTKKQNTNKQTNKQMHNKQMHKQTNTYKSTASMCRSEILLETPLVERSFTTPICLIAVGVRFVHTEIALFWRTCLVELYVYFSCDKNRNKNIQINLCMWHVHEQNLLWHKWNTHFFKNSRTVYQINF